MEIIVGLAIGLVLGLTGAGGSVFAVPLLIYSLHLSPSNAIGVSLGAVTISASVGVLTQLTSKKIMWLPAIAFSFIGAMFSPLGVYLNKQIDKNALMLSFSLLILIVAIRMWRQASMTPEYTNVVRSSLPLKHDSHQALCRVNNHQPFKIGTPCILGISAGAITTGVLSGLFGVGGGFLIVPTLLYLTGINIQQAVVTSLAVISFVSLSGFVSYLSTTENINFNLLGLVAFGGILGMTIGMMISRFIAGPALQKIFSVMMLVTAAITVSKTIF